MKLGFLLFDYFPFGGLQRDCLQVARECAARGHDITIFTRAWEGEHPAGMRVELFGRHGLTNVSRNRNYIRQLADALPQHALDGVVGFNKLPGLDVYFGSDPCFVAKAARLKPAWYRWLPRYRHYHELERAVFRRGATTQILLLTPHEIPVYQQHYGTEAERFHVLPPGIARRSFSEEQRHKAQQRVRAELGVGSDARLILFVGSGFRVKGLDRAIRGLAALPEALRATTRLVVIGRNQPGRFAWLAKRLGVGKAVQFLGGRSDVPDFLLAADVLVLPSLSESAGIVLIEAVAAGLPVVTTDTCGYAFHIEREKAGVVLPSPFDQSQLNRALARMLGGEELAAFQANGLAYAAREDLYSCHPRAADHIEETVARKQAISKACSSRGDEAHSSRKSEPPYVGCYGEMELSPHLRQHLPAEHTFDWLLNCPGLVHRQVKHRRTVEFERGGRRYFIKIHRGCGWREIFKNLFQGRAPVLSAETEWIAIERLQQAGVRTPTPAGKGLRGQFPARLESFIITEALEGMISLESLTRDWGGLVGSRQKLLKRALLSEVAAVTRTLHRNGLNHRDFYLCHFLVKDRPWREWRPGDPLELFLIDLHRVQIRPRVPTRWLVKDLGGLLFSAWDCGWTSRDLLRFLSVYRQRSWRQVLAEEGTFWRRVWRNACRLYARVHRRPANVPARPAGFYPR